MGHTEIKLYIQRLVHEEKILWRLLIYVLGLFIAAFGVAFAVNAQLGLSPMNSLPFVLSLIFDVYMGYVVTALLCLYILIQIILLRRDFKWVQLCQIFCSFLFGYFVNFTRMLLGDFSIPTYFGQLLLLTISMVCVSAGITLFMSVRLVPLPSEGLVAAIVQRLKNAKFHRVMIVLHTSVVFLGLGLSLLFLGGLYGVREGTVVSAVLIGKMMPTIRKIVSPLLAKANILT